MSRMMRPRMRAGPRLERTATRLFLGGDWRFTLLSVAILAAAWIAVTSSGLVRDLFLPGPALLWSGLLDLVVNGYKSRPLWEHILYSLERVLLGFGTGAVFGTLLGLAMGYYRKLDALLNPYVEFLRPLPQLAYLVLLIVWFGIGEPPKVILLFLTAFPVAAVAARDGVRNTSLLRIQAARSLGANEWQIFRHVIFPSALTDIFTGARLAIGIVYATLIAAEIIAGSTGIGWLVFDAGRFLRSDYVFVGIGIIGLTGLGLDRLLLTLELRVVHWAGK
jgi:taurine transport system permease protein